MPSAKIVDMDGADKGAVELDPGVFDVEPNEPLVHQAVVALRNAQHQGTHKTKERAEVRGGGAKPFRQKGTGRARQGSSREPHMRGGGTIFGPRPRSHRQQVPSRVRRQALCCVLSARAREERLNVLDSLKMDAPKTGLLAKMLAKIFSPGRKTLLVIAENDKNILLSARNIPRVAVRTAADVNVLDVIGSNCVLVQKEALSALEARLS